MMVEFRCPLVADGREKEAPRWGGARSNCLLVALPALVGSALDCLDARPTELGMDHGYALLDIGDQMARL